VAGKSPRACIYVLAGTNGAGKSSLAGAAFRERGAEYFNPDEAARRILAANPRVVLAQANSAAWHQGRRLLEEAIRDCKIYAFETTLGGTTISRLLHQALDRGIPVRTWYAGLESPELHIARVRARVAQGGHDIAEATIRARYTSSRKNLIDLVPRLDELRLFDNSVERDPTTGATPEPRLILHMRAGQIHEMCAMRAVPVWAKPIVASALRLGRPGPRPSR
jgi:predicted ABC-type ATPase